MFTSSRSSLSQLHKLKGVTKNSLGLFLFFFWIREDRKKVVRWHMYFNFRSKSVLTTKKGVGVTESVLITLHQAKKYSHLPSGILHFPTIILSFWFYKQLFCVLFNVFPVGYKNTSLLPLSINEFSIGINATNKYQNFVISLKTFFYHSQ